ncbi:TadE family protein [Vibrio owensii]|uniref:TadE family protein n=1 Tax=Vibrio owensii TaxID=696485 RepID=UPI003AAF2746
MKKQKGVASIEFALGFFVFWLCCVAWMEVNYLSYVSSTVDSVASHSAREAKKSSFGYEAVVKEVIQKESESWGGLIDENKFKGTIHYLKNRSEIATAVCDLEPAAGEILACGEPEDSSLAIYTISYEFNSIFSHFAANLDNLLKREMIIIQEYERDQFDI